MDIKKVESIIEKLPSCIEYDGRIYILEIHKVTRIFLNDEYNSEWKVCYQEITDNMFELYPAFDKDLTCALLKLEEILKDKENEKDF